VSDATPQDPAPKFEDALKELEELVARLEKGELSLEDSLRLYERGIGLARHCHAKLEEAEGKIELLMKDARGEVAVDAKGRPRTKPFELDEAE
jgi:exodeoxyribonuclease VII small subunit